MAGELLFAERLTMGIKEYLTAPRQVLASCELLPNVQRDSFLQALDSLIEAVKPHWQLGWQPRRLHGDAIQAISCGVMARCLSILMMPVTARRYSICGCYCTASAVIV